MKRLDALISMGITAISGMIMSGIISRLLALPTWLIWVCIIISGIVGSGISALFYGASTNE